MAADSDCRNDSAEVSWSLANGGDAYRASAVAEDGHRASCETDGQRCHLTELRCGRTYNVSLTTISDHCQTERLTDVTFSTRELSNNLTAEQSGITENSSLNSSGPSGPCQPLRVGVDLHCGTRAADMFWEHREDVELYVATASCSVGTALWCNSTNSTCSFSDLYCGETYNFSVTAFSDTCPSESSSTVEIQTGRARRQTTTWSGGGWRDWAFGCKTMEIK